MRQIMKPINTPDKIFHGGDPATGELGTVVTAEFLNDVQSSIIDCQSELANVVKQSNEEPSGKLQVVDAIRAIACSESRVKSVNGLTGDVVISLSDLGGVSKNDARVRSVNGRTGDVTITAADVGALPATYTPPAVRSVWLWSGDSASALTVNTPADSGIVYVSFWGNGYATWQSFPLNMAWNGQICGDIDFGGNNADRSATTGVVITKNSSTQLVLTPIVTQGSAARTTHLIYVGFVY